MRLFGIGLAILLAGAALYIETSFVNMLGEAFSHSTLVAPTILDTLWSAGPYISIGIMAFGVLWYWIFEPIIYHTRPKE